MEKPKFTLYQERVMLPAVRFLLNQPLDYTSVAINSSWEILYGRWANIRARLGAIKNGTAAALEYNERISLIRDIKRAKKRMDAEYFDEIERDSK